MAEEWKEETEKSVLAYCAQAGLFRLTPQDEKCPRVSVAVSGGADSMALLRILCRLAPELGMTVSACHVNHGLRGEAADKDEAFVREQCACLGVPLMVYTAAGQGEKVPDNGSENWARQLRYRCFAQEVEHGARWVATAHTGNDQAETLLFRLARGTGPHGAAAIRPVRGVFVRPLLCLTRQDTEQYCAAAGQPFVTDESNFSVEYARNRIRWQVLPALEQVNTAAVKNLRAFCDKMERVDAYLTQEGTRLLKNAASAVQGEGMQGPWSRQVLAEAPPLLLEAALHQLIEPIRDPEEKYVRLLAEAIRTGGVIQLTDTVSFAARGKKLRLIRDAVQETAYQMVTEYPLKIGEYRFPGGYEVRVKVLAKQEWENIQCVHKKDLKNVADYARIPMSAKLRTRQSGDRFYAAGRCGGKSLKKLYNEEGVPLSRRALLPLMGAESEVLWLWGHGFCQRLVPDEQTQQYLLIQEQNYEEENK